MTVVAGHIVTIPSAVIFCKRALENYEFECSQNNNNSCVFLAFSAYAEKIVVSATKEIPDPLTEQTAVNS